MRPELAKSELAQRIRQLAEKRDKQAETASDNASRALLREAAQNYRALADEVAREIQIPAMRGTRPTAG